MRSPLGRFAGSDVETVWRVDADPTGVTDARAAIQTAIDAASAAGGGTVYIPEGTYKVVTAVAGTVSIVPKSKVRILGAGVGRTILMAYGNAQCFYNNTASSGSPIIDVEIGHLEIDGTNQSNGGVYVSSMKGIQINYCKRHYYHDLYVHHCGATGVGSDYLYDSTYERIIADYNGRLASTSDAGGSGIGIGTGVYTVENLVVRDCVTRGNGVHGVFWENQGGVESTGMSLVNHYTANNGVHGIGECGVDRLRVIGGQTRANASAGFGSYKGTYSGASGPGKNIHIIGLEALGNLGHGFLFDAANDGIDGVYLEGVLSIGNGLNGVVLSNGAATCTGFKVLNSHIENNQRSGIRIVTTGGGITDVVISGCQMVANGRDAGAGTDRAGINLANSVTQLRIVNNRCWDSQGTKTQTYGLYCGTVTLTGGEINDNDFAQNLTAGVLVSGVTWSSFRVGRNNAWTISTGTPEGAVVAPIGTLFFRLDGGAGATLYVKESGTGNTGWAAK